LIPGRLLAEITLPRVLSSLKLRSTQITSAVAAAATNYSKLQAEMSLEVLNFDAFGKNEIKTWGCSPDAGALARFSLQPRFNPQP
jgi:hypothetical protein